MFIIYIPKEDIANVKKISKLFSKVSSKSLLTNKDRDLLALRINTTLQENINNKMDVNRKAMTPLSPKTYNRKKPPRGGPSATPLKDTGFLYGGMEYEVKNGVIILRNNTPYVKYHQDGTDKIPQRQIYPEKDLPIYLQQIINNFIDKRVSENIKNFLK